MNTNVPLIGTGKGTTPLGNFAKAEKALPIMPGSVKIPPIYYWEEVVDGKSCLMTMAFDCLGIRGMSYPIGEEERTNVVRMSMLRQKLFRVVKETLDVVFHHGKEVLDKSGDIDPARVNDQEAIKWKFDPHWKNKVSAFNQLCKIYPITKKKAIKLGLIN